ncbi:hypothetical protein R1sor_014662 [Riccia sorocarpa]|uniref:Reverse transcriptase zinc-binding domain-containing protein n=1 Tax=Riccia sorocarpa TaxID=122646 RepID=A0ABD3HA13_9MARC
MKYLAKLLTGKNSEWAQIIKYFIRSEIQRRAHGEDCLWWTPEEAMLLMPTLTLKHSPTSKNLLKGWFTVRKHLKLELRALMLPASLSFHQVVTLVKKYGEGTPWNERIVLPILRKLHITTLQHLRRSDGLGWQNIRGMCGRARITPTTTQETEITIFQRWMETVTITSEPLHQCPSWRWPTDRHKWSGWKKTSAFWRRMLTPAIPEYDLDSKWDITRPLKQWSTRWKEMWELPCLFRVKLWLWKIMRRAFFIGERAHRMTVADGVCIRCEEGIETIQHLFWSCRKAKSRWREFNRLLTEADHATTEGKSLLTCIDEGIEKKHSSEAFMLTLAVITKQIWRERNHRVFRHRETRQPLRLVLTEALEESVLTNTAPASTPNTERTEAASPVEDLHALTRCTAVQHDAERRTDVDTQSNTLVRVTTRTPWHI